MTYSYDALSATDFERLVRDLLSARLEIPFESFGPGPDGGIDLIHRALDGDTVVQCKHYAGSTWSALDRAVRQERPNVERLAPSAYLLVTSQHLTPARKERLSASVAPWCHGAQDVYGRDDLDGMLRDYPRILGNHPGLWQRSATVLRQVLGLADDAFDVPGYLAETVRQFGTVPGVCLDVSPDADERSADPLSGADRRSSPRPEQRETIDHVLSIHGSLLLTGPAGAGKSNMLRALVAETAARTLAGPDGGRVPIYVRPRPLPALGLVAHALGTSGPPTLSERGVHQLLASGQALLVLDDADQLDLGELDLLLDYRASGTQVVVAARPSPQLAGRGLIHRIVAPLTDEQIESLLSLWSRTRLGLGAWELLQEPLARRPMTLKFLAELHGDKPWAFGLDRADLMSRVLTRRLQLEAARSGGDVADSGTARLLLGGLALDRFADPDDPYGATPQNVRQSFHASEAEHGPLPPGLVDPDLFVHLDLLHAAPDPTRGRRYTFAHDQWQEYFAACELVRTCAPLDAIQPSEGRRAVARFAAALCTPADEVTRPDVWDRFWTEVASADLALAFSCLDARKNRAHEGEHGFLSMADYRQLLDRVPGCTQAEALVQFRRYLGAYRHLIKFHTPRIQSSLDPRTDGPIGLWVDGHDLSHLPHVVGVNQAFVPLRPGEPDVAVRTPLEYTYDDGHVDRPLSIGTPMLEGVPRVPSLRALTTFRRELAQAARSNRLWDPDVLLQERAYYQAVALFQAHMGRREPVPLAFDADALLDELATSTGSRIGTLPTHRSYLSGYRAPVKRADLDRTLNQLARRGLDAQTLAPPLRPAWSLKAGTEGSDAGPSAVREWAERYINLRYRLVREIINGSFPTAASSVYVYTHGYPVRVILSPHSTLDAPRRGRLESASLSTRWSPLVVWAFVDPELEHLVTVEHAETYEAAQLRVPSRGAHPPVGRPLMLDTKPTWLPLLLAVYRALEHSIEQLLGRGH